MIGSGSFLNNRYSNNNVIAKVEDRSKKLVIGTLVFKKLVTSSIRAYQIHLSEIGASMFLFSPTKETKIYLSSRIIEQANETVNEKLEIANTHDLDAQLRQVRSRLTSPRTYTRSRFSSQWTNRTSCQPYSIFTLLDRDFADSKNDSVIASSLLVCIADCMRFEKGLLKRSRLLEIALEQKMTSTSKLHQSILSMFNDDNIMNTIGNAQLEGLLVELAEICTHYLKAVNEGIKTNIINCLKELE